MSSTNDIGSQEQIEYLATKVMGWSLQETIEDEANPLFSWVSYKTKGRKTPSIIQTVEYDQDVWNPLEDWNHWRQVEEQVMENRDLWYKFICSGDPYNSTSFYYGLEWYVKADLPTRVSALISAYQELYGR